MTSVPLMVGLRYSGARSGNMFLSFISKVSLIGLILGVVALTVVVSVMDGFDRELKYRILGAVPHAVVELAPGIKPESVFSSIRGISAFSPFINRQGVVISGNEKRLASIYGIEPNREAQMSIIPDHIVAGKLKDLTPGANKVFLGRSLGFSLGLSVGDVVTVIIPEASTGDAIVPRLARLEVAGFFELNSELDYNLMLMNRTDLAGIVRDTSNTWRLSLGDVFLAPSVKHELLGSPGVEKVSTWNDEYGDFFRTVRMEKIMMFILLTLIVAIAAFNIVSGLSMMVKEKQADIAVFRTMGLSPGGVMRVFIVQGTVVGVLGTVLGMLLGIPLAHYIPISSAWSRASREHGCWPGPISIGYLPISGCRTSR